jgi:hypothetical protein
VIHLIERMHHTYILSKYLLNAAYVMAGLLMMYEKKGGDWHHSKYSVLTPDVMTMFTTTTVPSPSMHSVQRKDIECCNFFYILFFCVCCAGYLGRSHMETPKTMSTIVVVIWWECKNGDIDRK